MLMYNAADLGPGHNVLGFLGRRLLLTSGGPISDAKWREKVCCTDRMATDKKREVEQLWKKFFSDPSEWRDHRVGKANPRFPDFKHKKTQESLWLHSKWIPPWVEAKLAAMRPGIIKSSSFVWNQKLSGYTKAGQPKKTIELYEQMQQDGVSPDRFTFWPVLSACASLGVLEEGRRIHVHITQNGLESDVFVGSSLIDMYGKCGSIEDAEKVFKHMPRRDVVVWNAMIQGYLKCGKGRQVLKIYRQMQQEQVESNPVTLVAVLNACASVAALRDGRAVHEEIIRRDYQADVRLSNALVDMYGKCGSLGDAEIVFRQMPTRNVVTWNSMILGCVKCGEGQQALELYQQMQQEQMDPNPVTFLAVLNACASVAALEVGRAVHAEIFRRGYEADVCLSNCLIDMYGKCGDIEEAEKVFNWMHKKDVVTWNAMILGYVKCGEGLQALELYRQMKQEQMDPDPVTFVAILNACASVAALEEGKAVHNAIIQRGYQANVFVRSSLIDMYGSCGSIEQAERVFKQKQTRNVVVWTAMLAVYGRHGYAKEAIEHFDKMREVVEVNGVTFVSLLTACRHGGLVEDGLKYFRSMNTVYNISPTVEHYACVVDLLGRANRLCEAEDLIMSMPMDPDATVWMSLLSACRLHVNVEVGERCALRLQELEPEDSAGYVLLADIHVAAEQYKSSTGEVE